MEQQPQTLNSNVAPNKGIFKFSVKKILLVVFLTILPIIMYLGIFMVGSWIDPTLVYIGQILFSLFVPFHIIPYGYGLVINIVYIYILVSVFIRAVDYPNQRKKFILIGILVFLVATILAGSINYFFIKPSQPAYYNFMYFDLKSQTPDYSKESFLYNGLECHYQKNSRMFLDCNIDVIDVKDIPITNNEGKIQTLKFLFTINPKTPVKDGEATMNCFLSSLSTYDPFPNDQYPGTSGIGRCDDGVVIKDNTFSFSVPRNAIQDIISYKIDGPYLLAEPGTFFQYNVDGYSSISYIVNMDKFLISKPQIEKDREAEVIKNNESYYEIRYYETNKYTHDQFILN